MRFHSASVIRLADAKPVQLGHAARADGRWRLYAFADAVGPGDPASPLRALCEKSSGTGIRHYFWGGLPETVERLATRLKADYPQLEIAGVFAPPAGRAGGHL